MVIYDKQRRILRLFIKNVDEYIEKDDLDSILCLIAAFVSQHGFKKDGEWLNVVGKKLDKLYDEILEQNR